MALLRILLIFAATSLSLSHTSIFAAEPANKKAAGAPAAQKSLFNANVFEKSDYNMNFSDTVKLIREDEVIQVMFVKMPGFFTAPDDQNSMAILVNSQKNKSSVKVVVDEETRKIKSVSGGGGDAPNQRAASGGSGN